MELIKIYMLSLFDNYKFITQEEIINIIKKDLSVSETYKLLKDLSKNIND